MLSIGSRPWPSPPTSTSQECSESAQLAVDATQLPLVGHAVYFRYRIHHPVLVSLHHVVPQVPEASAWRSLATVAGTGLPPAVGAARWLRWCSALGAPGVSAALPGVCGEVLVGTSAGAGCGICGCRRRRAAAGVYWARTQCCAVPGGYLAWCSPVCCCFLCLGFACFVHTRSVRLTLLLLCSVFRILAVCVFLCCCWR